MNRTVDPQPSSSSDRRRVTVGGVLILGAIAVFVTFWTWALFFASKEAVNRIDDRAWAERAQTICVDATLEREALADWRRIDPDDLDMLRERGDLIDRSTDLVEQMLDDVTAVLPTDDKGHAIVPEWEAEYRTYLANRRVHADEVRAGSNAVFREAETGGIPISERLAVFAGDNEMPACSPPTDL